MLISLWFAGPILAQTSADFTYIIIDSTKQKWGDWDEPNWLRYFGLTFGDVNNDGNTDVISGRYIYQNPGSNLGDPWKRIVLDDNVDAIFSLDVDGDEYADIIAQALPGIYWYEALDVEGTVFQSRKIAEVPATSHVNSQGFETALIFAGGKEELLIAGNGNVYCIMIPVDTSVDELWETQLIGQNTSDEGIGVGDVDQDGDLDIVCGRRPEGEDEPTILVWFENPGAFESNWSSYEISTSEHPIDRVKVADLNNDNQMDIVVTEERYPGLEADANLYWFTNGNGPEKPWTKKLIATQYSSNNLDVADLDDDRDIDFITAEHKGTDLELQFWKNDGKGQFSKVILDRGKENHLGTKLIDIDNDGDLDIVGAGWDNYRWMHLWRNNTNVPTPEVYEVEYEGQPHFLIKTSSNTYYYDKAGGGFSRIIDRYGNDWVSFKREPWGEYPASAASSFRGLPNLVWQGENDGAGHPGHEKCSSWIERGKIITVSQDTKWKWSWEFFDDYAKLEILEADPDRKYWFLYEGTPGGKFDPDNTYFGTDVTGRSERNPDYFANDLYQESIKWMYVGHKEVENILYFVHLNQDEHPDLVSYLGDKGNLSESEDGMTVFGFGRNDKPAPLLSGQNQFIIGFYGAITNDKDHEKFKEYITVKFYQDNDE